MGAREQESGGRGQPLDGSSMKLQLSSVALLLGLLTPVLSAQQPQFTSLSAIPALTNEQAQHHYPVAFEATVTYFRSYERTLFVQDGDVAIYVQATTPLKFVPGDRILIKGTTRESFRPFVLSSDFKLLGHGSLPRAVPATFKDLSHSVYDCRLVTVRAQIRAADVLNASAHNSALQMTAEGGDVNATVDTDEASALEGMIDAEVEVTGAASGRFDGKMQQT